MLYLLNCSDGLWDVISVKKAMQLILQVFNFILPFYMHIGNYIDKFLLQSEQTREKRAAEEGNSAEKIANFILSEARTLRTKDNTSIIFLDFDTNSRTAYL